MRFATLFLIVVMRSSFSNERDIKNGQLHHEDDAKKRLAKVEAGKKILLQSTEQECQRLSRLTYCHFFIASLETENKHKWRTI